MDTEDEILDRLIRWGQAQPLVRAMILTSTRAIPNGEWDALSDYDIILVLQDVRPFFESRDWLAAFGRVLVMYRDPLETYLGYPSSGNVVQFEEGLKIDFTLWQVESFRQLVAAPALPDEFDAGYRVLLDKDGLSVRLPPPTYRAYISQPPTEEVYQEYIECSFLEAIYVAKYLLREDTMAANYVLDNSMKQEHLRPMLEWLIELDHGWSVKVGPYGRRMKKWLRPGLWQELEKTSTGLGIEENWTALIRTLALMRKVAQEAGEKLGYPYPHEMERRVMEFMQKRFPRFKENSQGWTRWIG